MTAKPTRPPLRYHGGKFRVAKKIIELIPPHLTYIEPFGGGAGVLLRKARSKNEIYNDLDGDIVNVFRVLRDPDQSKKLIELLRLTPFSREEMKLGWEETNDPVEQARRTIVRSHMGFGSAGATKGRTGFRGLDRCEASFSAPAKQWASLPDHLVAVVNRMQGVVVENMEAERLIENTDHTQTCFYVDPPYLPETRSSMEGG
ncbi:DNA adenine methylase [Sulfurimonas sp. ST-25]|uniref:DNA adenine methylase n=1 Tax=Sulfurimonas sp. ST-25 TaxID=3400151 RepID=UPI003A85E6CE